MEREPRAGSAACVSRSWRCAWKRVGAAQLQRAASRAESLRRGGDSAQAARRLQEAIFNHRSASQRIVDTDNGIRSCARSSSDWTALPGLSTELAGLRGTRAAQLGQALELRMQRERP